MIFISFCMHLSCQNTHSFGREVCLFEIYLVERFVFLRFWLLGCKGYNRVKRLIFKFFRKIAVLTFRLLGKNINLTFRLIFRWAIKNSKWQTLYYNDHFHIYTDKLVGPFWVPICPTSGIRCPKANFLVESPFRSVSFSY